VVTFDAVREVDQALPGAAESTSYGTPAFRVRGRLFLRLREEGDVLVVKIDFADREALIAERPAVYFLTDHYRNGAWVLVRLPVIGRGELRRIVTASWRYAAPPRLVAAFDAGGTPG
jgi:hypothetical protein